MASAWSLSADFSTINPYSVWSYGYKPPGYQVTGTFVLFTHLIPDPKGSGIVLWVPHENTPLSLAYNPNPITTILDGGGSKITYPPHGTDLFGIGDFKSYKSTKSGITVRENETIDFIIGN
ncbi:2956_t:CDS:2, partial [Racocetra fulgida]